MVIWNFQFFGLHLRFRFARGFVSLVFVFLNVLIFFLPQVLWVGQLLWCFIYHFCLWHSFQPLIIIISTFLTCIIVFTSRFMCSHCWCGLLLGESLAELYHGNAVSSQFRVSLKNWLGVCIPIVIFILNRHCHHLILPAHSECWLVRSSNIKNYHI